GHPHATMGKKREAPRMREPVGDGFDFQCSSLGANGAILGEDRPRQKYQRNASSGSKSQCHPPQREPVLSGVSLILGISLHLSGRTLKRLIGSLGAAGLHAKSRRWPLQHYLAAEAIELRRPPPAFGPEIAGGFDQPALLDQAPEVLLVQERARNRFHGLLQIKQGKCRRQ